MDQVGVEAMAKYLPFIVPIVLIQLGLMVFAMLDLVRRERFKHLPKWLWALIILFGQLLGPLAYLILGRED